MAMAAATAIALYELVLKATSLLVRSASDFYGSEPSTEKHLARREEKCQEKVIFQSEKCFLIRFTVVW